MEEVVGAAGLNLLINNAGVGRMPRALHSITPEEMAEHFATNCTAPLFLSRGGAARARATWPRRGASPAPALALGLRTAKPRRRPLRGAPRSSRRLNLR